jgi:phosphatidylserine decarboxylase
MSSTEYRVGEWLPSDQKILNDWLLDLIEEVATEKKHIIQLYRNYKI